MSKDTDDEYQIKAAAQSYKWKWLSDMHKSGTIKTNTKDGMILLLVLFQKIFRDNQSERPLMALYGFSVAVSGILIFFISNHYWGGAIGFWLMMLYLLSAWPWQTALYGGHVGVSTMVFLASILVIQQINPAMPNFFVLITSGILFCYMLFSSGSSVKYVLFFFTALIESRYHEIIIQDGIAGIIPRLSGINYKLDMLVLISIGILFLILKIFKKIIINRLYSSKNSLITRLNIIKGQELFPREHYYQHADKKLPQYFKNLIITYIFLSIIIHLLGFSYILPIIIGFSILFLILTLPDIKLNSKNYLRHILSPVRKTRFEKYMEYFNKQGIKISADFRAPLLQLLPLVSWRIAPIQTVLLIGLIVIVFFSSTPLISKVAILLIASLPVLWGELTRTTRSLRTYSPALMGILIFLGYSLSIVTRDYKYSWIYIITITVIIAIHQIKLFLTDILPSRMAISNLVDTLHKYNIKEFYTYDTAYNDSLVNAVKDKFNIHYINSLKDIDHGWIVIPPTNSKSVSMEASPEAINGDYTKDPKLNELLISKKIEKIATAKFKTFSSSRIWAQEADVSTYMDLILKEVSAMQRFRGYAWLVRGEDLSKE